MGHTIRRPTERWLPDLEAKYERELRHYFEYSPKGLEVLEGLQEVHFGEYLVEQGAIDRLQLFRALQMQDRYPGVRIGECAAALGFLGIGDVEKLYQRFLNLSTVTVP